MVEFEQTAESLFTHNPTGGYLRSRTDQLVAEPLMRSFVMVVVDIFSHDPVKMLFA